MSDKKEEVERILKYSTISGPSGFEDEVASEVTWDIHELNPVEDHMRNVHAILNPDVKGPKVMLDSHMDEVGLIVQAVKPNGTMRFLKLGGFSQPSIPGSSFRIRNKSGEDINAVVAVKPPHFQTAAEKGKAPEIEDMVLDCGSTSKEETENTYHLGIGSPAVPDVKAKYYDRSGLFYGKAFDNRIGVAAEIETLKELMGEDLPCQVSASFAVQEEVGERGVYANYKALRPDVMIAFEGCPADDTFQEPYMIQAALRKGPMLRNFDVSMITNHRFQQFAVDLANELHIPVQESVRSGGGTDGGRIYPEGVPSIVIGVPVRYIHSSYCWCTYEDYRAAVDLAIALCRRLTAEAVEGF